MRQGQESDLEYPYTLIYSISGLHIHCTNFKSQAAIVSENSLFLFFPLKKPKLPSLTLPQN